MNFSTTLIGILFLLIFIVPILYAVIKAKANKGKVEQLTLALMKKHQLTPTDNIAIGSQQFFLDTHSKKLMHLEIKKSKITDEHIWEISQLKTVKAQYSHYTSPTNVTFISEISLKIQEKGEMESSILIYDEDSGNLTEAEHYRREIETLVDQVNSLL